MAVATMLSVLSLIGVSSAASPPRKPARPSVRPAKPRAAKPLPPAKPPSPLPMLPSIPRVRLEILKAQLIVIEEVNLPRGDWKGDDLDFYVSFGAPGTPRAVDAQLVAVGDGALEPEEGDVGESLVVAYAARRPISAHALLGRDAMAGVVVHVKRDSLERALAPGNMAALRVRTALDLPEEDSASARGVVVRLGASRGTPLTLGRITVRARSGAERPARAEAHLCGPDADETALAVGIVPRPALGATSPGTSSIAPVLAVRHATDDLCIRFWSPSP